MDSGENRAGHDDLSAGEAALMLYTVDDRTGSAYIRQWLMPAGEAEAFAADMTARHGEPAEVFADAERAASLAGEVMLTLGDPGDGDER